MKQILALAKKELLSFFSTPIALIFIGTYLLVSLFVFFWVEEFFSRNIADVRPLFDWLPLLMIFLVAALTMRMWSEERRAGTLEFLFTEPVPVYSLVLGKFLSCLSLVAIALLLTLPLPISISFIGNLDWGPIFGSYIAAMLLASAYISIGIFLSARTDNQIVSLMFTILICMAIYLVGSDKFTGLLNFELADFFRFLGTGSRFESITRGVIDLRDLYYYLSITGLFLALNCLSLEKLRWSKKGNQKLHRSWVIATALLGANLLAANFWLDRISFVRVDLTEGNIYSISPATKEILQRLDEPLLIRGYFSAKTHPLLSPLVPQLKDLLEEYHVAGGDKLRVEFIDPQANPELEREANEKYGIKPIPFQVADRYQAALVNSYFDLLVQYGDKTEQIGFDQLIEVKMRDETDLSVKLKNPEYELTRTIKKALQGFNSLDSLFASIKKPIKFTGYFSAEQSLPKPSIKLIEIIREVLNELKTKHGEKFDFDFVDPDANGGKVAQEIAEKFKFRPIRSLVDPKPFYFNMVMTQGDRFVVVPLPEAATKEGITRSVTSALKRFSTGFLKTVGYFANEERPANPMMQMQPGRKFEVLREQLRGEHLIRVVDLNSGVVPEEVDLLTVLAPKDLNEKQLFAIDQFLMKGGTLLLSTSPYLASRAGNSLRLEKINSGLSDWLATHGITMEDKLVLDPQNEPYPVPVPRDLGGFMVEEMRMLPYPYFIDVRGEGLNAENTLVAGIPQVTINWASPLKVKAEAGRTVTELLKSSSQSWLSDSLNAIPDFDRYGEVGFPVADPRSPQLVAAVVEGRFKSYFADRENPLAAEPASELAKKADAKKVDEKDGAVIPGVIAESPESARIFVVSSNEFVNDLTLQISAAGGTQRFTNSLQLMQNAVDWSLEDRGLLSIRSRSQFARTLNVRDQQKPIIEYANYLMAVLGLILLWVVSKWTQRVLRVRREGAL